MLNLSKIQPGGLSAAAGIWYSKMEKKEKDDREYIELLPWPLNPVFHELDERFQRIKGILD